MTALFLTLLLLATTAVAQKSVPPPPKPADSGPSLEVTMKFIQDKLNEQGTFNYVVFIHDDVGGSDWVVRRSSAATNFVADPSTCRVSYHQKHVINGKTVGDVDLWFALRYVRSLAVMTIEQNMKIVDTDGGNPSWSYRAEPTFSVLRVKRTDNAGDDFLFHDEDSANRVAKALTHAVELCGGGENEPF
jgi:hypothetical protein